MSTVTIDPEHENFVAEDVATRVYFSLLRSPNPRRSHLRELGYTDDEITSSLATLHARAVVRVTSQDAIEVLPPEPALTAYAANLERQARETRASVDGLSRMYYEARAGDQTTWSDPGVVRLDTVDDIDSATTRITAEARSRVVRLCARSPRIDDLVINHADELIFTPHLNDRPNLERLIVLEQSILERDGSFAALERLRADGIEVRMTPHLAFSVTAADRLAAVVDISHLEGSDYPVSSSGGSIAVRQRPLASALMDMSLGIFSLAAPLPRTPRASRTPPSGHTAATWRLSERDGRIIALLAAGASDQTISRQLSISTRTVERRIRAVLDELGATTRFQAGVIAARRGLL